MKKILLAILLLVAIDGYAQDEPVKLFPVKDGKVVYEEVVEVPGAKKDQIYKAAKKWFVDTFVSSKTVLQSEDKEGGQIIGKALLVAGKKGVLGSKEFYNTDFSIQIDCKDGKYRYRIYDIVHTLDGKKETDMFAKYFVNIPAEKDNAIASGEKGYSKGQAKNAVKTITVIDADFNNLITDLKNAVKSGSASDDF